MSDMEVEKKVQSVSIVPTFGYMDLLLQGGGRFLDAVQECKDCGLKLSWDTLQAHANVSWAEVLCLLLCALAWTLFRRATTTWIFQPFATWCQLQPKEAEKFPESAWKLLFYSTSWSYSVYLLFFTEYNFFQDPSSAFYDWKPGGAVPRNIALAYLIQGSFYAHSTYATLYMDAWRKDSIVMILHHLVTFTLITFSYAFRYHNIGILVLFLHDVNDIQLEFTKINVYFKTRGEKYHRTNDIISDIGCVTFSFSWFWFRLYWFPQKVLFATCYSSLESNPNIPFYFFFNILLFVLTLMNIYWFLFIILFVGKVLTGQVQDVNDVREYDIDNDQKVGVRANCKSLRHKNTLSNGQSLSNGFVKKKKRT
ncbi:ceramide synthase 1 [Spea bombifrons]|uniref:ceramide synthase 1 n=1 Tax=Spea bombifrons TaxID=233779 RepID=UPI00234A8098|nr:ceramide synthase 1 [Spea bombifrons]